MPLSPSLRHFSAKSCQLRSEEASDTALERERRRNARRGRVLAVDGHLAPRDLGSLHAGAEACASGRNHRKRVIPKQAKPAETRRRSATGTHRQSRKPARHHRPFHRASQPSRDRCRPSWRRSRSLPRRRGGQRPSSKPRSTPRGSIPGRLCEDAATHVNCAVLTAKQAGTRARTYIREHRRATRRSAKPGPSCRRAPKPSAS